MAENLIITEGDKEQQYQTLFPQIEALLAGETDMTANMANVAAALKQTFDFFLFSPSHRDSCLVFFH